MKRTLIGVMGPGASAKASDIQNAYKIGQYVAQAGWVLLSGGRNLGVMQAASQGAKQANGLTVGILPGPDADGVSEFVDIAIFTDMGSARNNINVLSSDVVIACGMGPGTASEIALALKANKWVILLNDDPSSQAFFAHLSENIFIVSSPEEAIRQVRSILQLSTGSD